MSDITAIAEKLATLQGGTDAFENGARVIAQGGAPSGMCALIRAIDETVLERKLEIMTGSHIVTLVAAGRRLRGIAGVVPPNGKSARVIDQPLSRDDRKSLALAQEVLTEVLSSAPRITLRSLPSDGFGSAGERGISAAGLADLWGVNLGEAPQPPMDRFLQGNAASLKAYLHLRGGDVVATHGDTDTLQKLLDEQLDTFVATRAKLSGNSDGPQLISLEGALGDETGLAIGEVGDELVVLAFNPAALGQLHTSWQAVFG